MKNFSSFNNESQTFDYILDETTREFCCNTCSYKSKNKQHTINHLRKHSGFKPYKCDVCNSSFVQSSNLKKHKQNHTGDKPYTCDICNFSFAQSSYLKKHKLTHTGERPYKCNVCSSSFSESTKVKIHMRTHTGCSEVYIKGIVNLVKEALKTTFEFVGPAEGILNLLGTPCSVLSG